jgi:alpha-2-macroglobulin
MTKNSTLRRLLSSICLLTSISLLSITLRADDSVPASGYRVTPGEAFFLLSDRSFGSEEVASVRLEAPGRDQRRLEIEAYGGIDIRVYHVPDALKFLRAQPNLHRIQIEGNYQGESLSNVLSYLWDNWYKQSRRSMQRTFAGPARAEVTAVLPQLASGNTILAPTQFNTPPQFGLIKGLALVDAFRYPLFAAKPIATPPGVKLDGSTDSLMDSNPGNVYVPIGKREPGLYVIEAIIGKYRALTTVFVSDTIAVSKIAGKELLVWTVQRGSGAAVANTNVLWTDGVGVLQSGTSDASGVLRLRHASPERSYLLGLDPSGGVFVGENFYYESEIYNTKLFATTDRPLYRPGDQVHVKLMARTFLDATHSQAARAAPVQLSVIDAAGANLLSQNVALSSVSGAHTDFYLPIGATAGGYELRMRYLEQDYSAAFRVAEYVKPHFEISLSLDQPEFRTGQAVTGKLSLLYPDGKPVVGANISLTLRAQQQSMIDHELAELGQFPVELTSAELLSDGDGAAALVLPASDKPARYLLTIFATDGAAFRVKTTREILIERNGAQFQLRSDKRFSSVGEAVNFSVADSAAAASVTDSAAPAGAVAQPLPTSYRWVRLEDQRSGVGSVANGAFSMLFDTAGTYNLFVLDAADRVVGGTEHRVSGSGLVVAPGSVQITLDRSEYQLGDVASALISFSEPVQEALLTLERDGVEAHALLSQPANWLRLEKLSAVQYRAQIPVRANFAPNLSFSVLYAAHGEYAFEVKGIKVKVPSIAIAVKANADIYKPGALVELDLTSSLSGRGKASRITLSVVDEMVYALQPEIAPDISDFFFHPRRNAVRTSASLSFVAYDLALPFSPVPKSAGNRSERGVKVLERPRRDEVDTALFEPDLVTDAQGRVKARFVMPDSLTRWRITARAVAPDGSVGQSSSFIRSEQPLYLTWSAAKTYRVGDRPNMGVIVFNTTTKSIDAQLRVNGSAAAQALTLSPGARYVALAGTQPAGAELNLRLEQNGVLVDQLRVRLAVSDPSISRQSETLALTAASTPLALPADAKGISLRLMDGDQALLAAHLDQLIDYPWWGAEGISSALLPLSVAYPTLASGSSLSSENRRISERVRLAINTSRLRLMHIASENAYFRWYYGAQPDAFLTAYAYTADWHATKALGVTLDAAHWQRVQDAYAEHAGNTPWLQRALIMQMANDMALPIETILTGLMTELAAATPDSAAPIASDSLIMVYPNSALAIDAARVACGNLARANKIAWPAAFAPSYAAAQKNIAASNSVFLSALSARNDRSLTPPGLVALLSIRHPVERALALSWFAPPNASNRRIGAPSGAWEAGAAGSYQWRGITPPTAISLASTPSNISAQISYDSAQSGAGKAGNLPVVIHRKLYKLLPQSTALAFAAEPVLDGIVDSNALYVDEIELSASGVPQRYGVVEVPLPPGAEIERTTWGLRVTGLAGTETQGLERAQFEDFTLGYQLPVDGFAEAIRFRHLLRFGQTGQFVLPPVRYRKIYAPGQTAQSEDSVKITVR